MKQMWIKCFLCTVVSNYGFGSLQRFSFFLLNLAEMHHYCNNLNNFLLFSEKLRFTFFSSVVESFCSSLHDLSSLGIRCSHLCVSQRESVFWRCSHWCTLQTFHDTTIRPHLVQIMTFFWYTIWTNICPTTVPQFNSVNVRMTNSFVHIAHLAQMRSLMHTIWPVTFP